jgi:hypothetical protein
MENRVLKRGEGSQRLGMVFFNKVQYIFLVVYINLINPDDNIDSILKRFHTYTTETLPIVEVIVPIRF